MLQAIVEAVLDTGLQALGWLVLKAMSFGRYRGFRPEDLWFEGTVGFATVVAVGFGVYRLWPQ
jgi:hypothetical protein